MARRDIIMIKQFSSCSSSSACSNKFETPSQEQEKQQQYAVLTCESSQEASGFSGGYDGGGGGGSRGGGGCRGGEGYNNNIELDNTYGNQVISPTITIGTCTTTSSSSNSKTSSRQIRSTDSRGEPQISSKYKQRRQLSFNTNNESSDQAQKENNNSLVGDNQFNHSSRLALPRSIQSISLNSSSGGVDKQKSEQADSSIYNRKKQQATTNTTFQPKDQQIIDYQAPNSSQPRLRPIPSKLQYPNLVSSSQRLQAPRMSLLGKPIYLSSHKSKYRNTPSMRWKMRLRSFLEQPQGLLPWLYHFSL